MTDNEIEEMKKEVKELETEKMPPRPRNNYRIIRIEDDPKVIRGYRKITMCKFYAESNEEANTYLKDYRKTANREYKYYWDFANQHYYKGKYYDDSDDTRELWLKENHHWYTWIVDFFTMDIPFWWERISNPVKDIWFYIRHYNTRTNKSYQRTDFWNIDGAILDILLFNIPRLIKDSYGIPQEYIEKAYKQMGITGEEEKHEKWEEADKIASKMWRDELESILLEIHLYDYYVGYGIVDKNDPVMTEIDRKYSKTIPYYPGSYDVIDGKKLEKITQRHWNTLMDKLRLHLQEMWF